MELQGMVNALIEYGFKQDELAKLASENSGLSISQSTISRIVKTDNDPGYRKGKAIEVVYLHYRRRMLKKAQH